MTSPCLRWLVCLLGCAVCLAGPAVAGPPLVTDDPETPKQGGWEFNLSHNIEMSRDDFLMAVPLFDLSYSFFDNQQFNFVLLPIVSDDPTDGPNHWGVGDLAISYKVRFLEQDQAGFMASVNPHVLIPTGNKDLGIGDGRVELFLPLEVGRRFFDNKLFLWSEVGLTLVLEDGSANAFQWGVAAEWELNDKFSLLAEVAGTIFNGSDGTAFVSLGAEELVGPDDAFFNIGIWYVINDNVSFIASAGRSFHDEGHDLLTYVGFQITWGGEED